ncbi:hypothetical protein ON010_g10657 [Phytophthora cinnamomi]|nr:hypothetical protein ON010_g10657 [Phytophthora cinnamomi]
MVEILVEFAQAGKWRRWRKYALSMLMLLGEDDALDHAQNEGGGHVPILQASAASSFRSSEMPACATRCFHCRQVVHAPMQANLCVMPCPYCQKSIAVASDNSSAAIDTLPAVVEDNSFSNGSKGSSVGEPDFVCVNCSKAIELPDGLSPTEIVCPHCLQLAAVKKTSQAVMPAFSSEKKRSSTSSARSVESGASLPKDPSLSGIDVRDTKVTNAELGLMSKKPGHAYAAAVAVGSCVPHHRLPSRVHEVQQVVARFALPFGAIVVQLEIAQDGICGGFAVAGCVDPDGGDLRVFLVVAAGPLLGRVVWEQVDAQLVVPFDVLRGRGHAHEVCEQVQAIRGCSFERLLVFACVQALRARARAGAAQLAVGEELARGAREAAATVLGVGLVHVEAQVRVELATVEHGAFGCLDGPLGAGDGEGVLLLHATGIVEVLRDAGDLAACGREALVVDGQGAVHALDAVLQEERHLDARVLEEAAQVLLEHVEVRGAHAAEVLRRELDGLAHEALHLRGLDEVFGVGEVVHGHLQQLVSRGARQHLVLEAHAHEVVELQQHDVKTATRSRAEAKSQTFGALVARDVLGFQTLVQHVDHLGAHVHDEHGHRHQETRHG